MKIFVQVGAVDAAREAVRQGADVVVAQGTDAGGHQIKVGAGVVVLVPEVRDLVEKEGKGEVAVVAAGGLVDGRGVVAALGLGMPPPSNKAENLKKFSFLLFSNGKCTKVTLARSQARMASSWELEYVSISSPQTFSDASTPRSKFSPCVVSP